MGTLALLLIASCVILHNIESPSEGAAPIYERSLEQGNRKYLPRAYYAQVYEWKALALNATLFGLLLASAWWWVSWVFREKAEPKPVRSIGVRPTRVHWSLLALGLAFALAIRIPMMNRPILFDEQDNLRKSIHGYVDIKSDGTRVWRGATWSDTFFENRRANSPVLFGILARGCIDIWRAFSGAEKEYFNIVALRLPSLVAGVVAMFLLWRLLLYMGFPIAAVLSVFLMAVHPMAVEYHLQARGYGVMLCFATLAALSAYLGIRSPRWRWWILYGFSQFAMLYAYPGALYFAISTNGLLGLFFIARWLNDRRNPNSWAALVRFILVNVFSAMLYLQVMLPSIVQAQSYLDRKFAKSELRPEWTFSVWSIYTSGAWLPPLETWWMAIPEEERFIMDFVRDEYLPEKTGLAALSFLVVPVVLGVGFWRLKKKDRVALLLMVAGLLAPFLAYLHSRLFTGLWIYQWYIIYLLPSLVSVLAIGATSLGGGKRAWIRSSLGAVTFFGLFVVLGEPRLPTFRKAEIPDHTDIQRTNHRYRIYKEGLMERVYDPPPET